MRRVVPGNPNNRLKPLSNLKLPELKRNLEDSLDWCFLLWKGVNMKALADLRSLHMSTTTVAPPLHDDDSDYQLQSFGRSRHGLHAVSLVEIPVPSDQSEVDEAEFPKEACDSRSMVSNIATNLVIRPAFKNKGKATRMTNPKLTTEEFIEVRLATVRESTRHCYWPVDVVARFTAADVIR
jgi:hypothetical protein